MPARLLRALAAILAGNAFYFLLASPHLPEAARHQAFAADLGLAIDFAVCGAIYLLLGVALKRRG
jgi:hypothetical protein